MVIELLVVGPAVAFFVNKALTPEPEPICFVHELHNEKVIEVPYLCKEVLTYEEAKSD